MNARFPVLDQIVHQHVRLGILTALSVYGRLSYRELKRYLQASDGNIGVQTRTLKQHDYINEEKSFEDNFPKTIYWITPAGLQAYKQYVGELRTICV